MTFNGAISYRLASSSPGRYAGQDNGWALALIYPALIGFAKSIIEYPSIRRFPGEASNDLPPICRPVEAGVSDGSKKPATDRRFWRLTVLVLRATGPEGPPLCIRIDEFWQSCTFPTEGSPRRLTYLRSRRSTASAPKEISSEQVVDDAIARIGADPERVAEAIARCGWGLGSGAR